MDVIETKEDLMKALDRHSPFLTEEEESSGLWLQWVYVRSKCGHISKVRGEEAEAFLEHDCLDCEYKEAERYRK